MCVCVVGSGLLHVSVAIGLAETRAVEIQIAIRKHSGQFASLVGTLLVLLLALVCVLTDFCSNRLIHSAGQAGAVAQIAVAY